MLSSARAPPSRYAIKSGFAFFSNHQLADSYPPMFQSRRSDSTSRISYRSFRFMCRCSRLRHRPDPEIHRFRSPFARLVFVRFCVPDAGDALFLEFRYPFIYSRPGDDCFYGHHFEPFALALRPAPGHIVHIAQDRQDAPDPRIAEIVYQRSRFRESRSGVLLCVAISLGK